MDHGAQLTMVEALPKIAHEERKRTSLRYEKPTIGAKIGIMGRDRAMAFGHVVGQRCIPQGISKTLSASLWTHDIVNAAIGGPVFLVEGPENTPRAICGTSQTAPIGGVIDASWHEFSQK